MEQFGLRMLISSRRERVSSVTRNGEFVNATLDDVESTIYSLTGLVTPILMARALKTGTGQYSEIHRRVHTIMHGPISAGAGYNPRPGNNADFVDGDRPSCPSRDSVFNIEPATQEADPPRSSSSQNAPDTSPPPQSHSATIQSPKHDGDPQKPRIQQESGQGTREMIEIKRKDLQGTQQKGNVQPKNQAERQEKGEIEREDQREVQEMGKTERKGQQEIREPERPSPMIMTSTAAAGVALGGTAAFTADHLSSHGSEDQGGRSSVRRSNDSGYGGSLENDDDDGCCGCCGDDEDEEHGCCFGWH